MDKKFYVYRHIRLDTNTPFYVGKGSGRRAFRKERNKYWKHISNKFGYKIEIILEGLEESDAFNKEKQIIRVYKEFNYCEANLHEGGKGGTAGYKIPKEKLVNRTQKGEKHPRFGKEHSDETKKAISEKLKGKYFGKSNKQIISSDGVIYDSASEASRLLDCSRWKIRNILSGKTKNPIDGLTFEYYQGVE